MQNISPLLQTDFYKQSHYAMYPAGMDMLYSNLTPRKSRVEGVNHIVVFGLQYFIKEYLMNQWDKFFKTPFVDVEKEYLRMIDSTLGPKSVTTDHLHKLHELGYLPLSFKALPEGVLCPVRVPCCTIQSTVKGMGWLVNFMETILSCTVWQPMTSATIALEFRKIFSKFSKDTVGNTDLVQYLGHDFSMRGMSSLESACTSGAGHLLSFTGTDTIPAISFLEEYYNADVTKELVGASVPASEHSVLCAGGQEDEIGTFGRLLDVFPTGILSMVSDTWSLPFVLVDILPALKEKIQKREGKLVIRPDSFWTDPVDCLCGFDGYHPQMQKLTEAEKVVIRKGLVESLWDIFSGTVSEKGYKVLAPCIGCIYGDAITRERAEKINIRLKDKGFASTNWTGGIGSFAYQFNTRDTFGFAMKATYCEVGSEARDIFKDPVTDDGMKKSAKGLLRVDKINGEYVLKDCCTKEEEQGGELKEVFRDGKLLVDQTLAEIRARVQSNL